MSDSMGMFHRHRRPLVRFWLTLIVLGGAMVVGTFLGEVLPLGGQASAQELEEEAGDPADRAADGLRATLAGDSERWEDGPAETARVLAFPVQGDIDLGLSAFLGRALDDAEGVDLVVLDIDTFGGRVDAAVQIRDLMMELDVPSVAFIHPRAISAGALIALS
ncbi:MAG: hypothetical protein QGH45_10330, partial [Myxococcota bacterium]|nr:hypothetical protein [Myxococcota bacterium]